MGGVDQIWVEWSGGWGGPGIYLYFLNGRKGARRIYDIFFFTKGSYT